METPLRSSLIRTLTAVLSLALALVATGACDGGTAPDSDPMVSGVWSGSSMGITLDLTLAEGDGGAIAGSGHIGGGGLNVALDVSQGTHVDPNVSLLLSAQGYEDMNFSGRMVSDNEISGTLNGSGFSDFNLNLRKEEQSGS